MWIFAGFFWGAITIGILWGEPVSWKGERTFQGCLSSDPQTGKKMQWVELLAELDGSVRLPVRIGVPIRRASGELRQGDCLSGTVSLSSYPDVWERAHLFGSVFRPLLFEGVLSPWDSFHVSHPVREHRLILPHFSSLNARIQDRFLSLFHPDVSAILLAMVLSEPSHLSPELLEEFQRSGVYHLLSVSGEHMALLAIFLSGGLILIIRLLPYPVQRIVYARWPIALLVGVCVIPVMGCYLILIGSPLPALRAVGGFALVLVARLMGFRWSWEDSLGISVVALCLLNPDSPLSLSLDLSLSALFGVAIFLRMGRGRREGDHSSPAGFEFREAMVLGSVITVTTLPLLWFSYQQLDWVGILSNGVIVPVAGDLFLPAGFLYGLFLGLVPAGWWPLTGLLEKLGESVVGLVSLFSRFPDGQIPLPPLSPVGFIVLCGSIMGGLMIMMTGTGESILKKRLVIASGCLTFVFAVLLVWGRGAVREGEEIFPVRAIVNTAPVQSMHANQASWTFPTGSRVERIAWSPERERMNWEWMLGR
ncbi:MAG: ComEC/Rec2 family competence protein [Leptospirales bacterium]